MHQVLVLPSETLAEETGSGEKDASRQDTINAIKKKFGRTPPKLWTHFPKQLLDREMRRLEDTVVEKKPMKPDRFLPAKMVRLYCRCTTVILAQEQTEQNIHALDEGLQRGIAVKEEQVAQDHIKDFS